MIPYISNIGYLRTPYMSTIPIDEFSLSLVSLSTDSYYPHDEIDDTFLQYSTSIHHISGHRKSTSLTDAIGEDLSPLPPPVRPNFFSKIDLDMTRISDRIIVVSQCWRHRTEKKSFRNNVHEMAIFLETRYQNAYMIWNFSPHVDDLYAAFDSKLIQCQKQLSYIPYSLGSILEICSSMTAWLRLHPNHIVISHCPNGRQLSGMIIACLLRYCECFDSTRESIEYFIQRRSPSDSSWFTQTMKRILRYFQDALLLKGIYPNPLPLSLRQVILNSVPNFDGNGSCSPGLEIYINDQLVYSSLLLSKQAEEISFISNQDQLEPLSNLSNTLNFSVAVHKSAQIQSELFQDSYHIVFQFGKNDDCSLPVLYGNVFIRLFHRNPITLKGVTMFTCSFHTGWMKTGLIRFRSRDLDLSPRDKQSLGLNRFSSDFSMDLILTNTESQSLFDPGTESYTSECCNEQLKEESAFKEGRRLEKEFTVLSQYHPIIPDANLLRPLELQDVPRVIARLSLQSRHNDLHLAHEFIHYFKTTVHYQELEHEQEEQKVPSPEQDKTNPSNISESINSIPEVIQRGFPLNIKVGTEAFRRQLEEKLVSLKTTSIKSLPISAPTTAKNVEKMERLLFLSPPSDSEKKLIGSPPRTSVGLATGTIRTISPSLIISPTVPELIENRNESLIAPPPPLPPPLLDSLASPVSPSRGRMIKYSLHWKAIYQLAEAMSNNKLVWTTLSKRKFKVKLDFCEFEKLFCIDPSIEVSRLTQQSITGYNSDDKNQQKIEPLLDFRRTNNIAIGLSKLGKKFTDESLFHAIVSRTGELNIDDLTTLRPLLPSTEERDLFILSKRTRTVMDSDNMSIYSSYGIGSSSTIRVENFMLQMCTEPNLSWMVDALIFELSYDNDYDQLTEQLNEFVKAFDTLSANQDIQVLLSFALELGNMASFEYGRSRYRKKAIGFHIDSLNMFKDVKSVKTIQIEDETMERQFLASEWTLLDYLVEILHKQTPSILKLPDRIEPILEKPKQIESALLSNSVKDLQTGMAKLKTLPHKSTLKSKEFLNSILCWRESKKQKMKELTNLYQEFKTIWETVARYFGEDPDEKHPEDLINTWSTFLKQMRSSMNKLEPIWSQR